MELKDKSAMRQLICSAFGTVLYDAGESATYIARHAKIAEKINEIGDVNDDGSDRAAIGVHSRGRRNT
jgi:hypothetical protein